MGERLGWYSGELLGDAGAEASGCMDSVTLELSKGQVAWLGPCFD